RPPLLRGASRQACSLPPLPPEMGRDELVLRAGRIARCTRCTRYTRCTRTPDPASVAAGRRVLAGAGQGPRAWAPRGARAGPPRLAGPPGAGGVAPRPLVAALGLSLAGVVLLA